MLKKLTDDKLIEILDVGISEFAKAGPDKANMKVIAKKAGISVGVLYKYYNDKENFFLSCLNRSLELLESILHEVIDGEEKILVRAEKMIRTVQQYSRKYNDYVNMYNEITSGSCKKYAPILANKIEGVTAKTYTLFIEKAIDEGHIRDDIDPKMFAFFFDNMLMTLEFSYCSDYYKERFKIYCGDDILNDDEKVVRELVKFLESAFTFSSKDIKK